MSAVVKQPYPIALPIAQRLVEALRPWCDRIELAGSIRRERPQVGDIEIVAIPRRLKDLFGHPIGGLTMLDSFLDDRAVAFTKRGERYQQFTYGRFTVDLFLPTAETWGSTFTIRTGSWEFSRWLVTSRAAGGPRRRGWCFGMGGCWLTAGCWPRPRRGMCLRRWGWPGCRRWSGPGRWPSRCGLNLCGNLYKEK